MNVAGDSNMCEDSIAFFFQRRRYLAAALYFIAYIRLSMINSVEAEVKQLLVVMQ
jgi:hypothetical protein